MAQLLGSCTHVGDMDRIPGIWCHPGSALAIMGIWGNEQWMVDILSLSLPLSLMYVFLCHCAFK